ncbi:DUF945 domain-containing protein [Sulfurimonas lithotrophica]|uniref:DUF945 domain-containing protein n=1 Tax=Sulfurimonas lithotrophica TaxID=2590022 RepID=A0A5P8P3T3_9BACT|nr:hypothetical protein [Sulfurimonas lithotrophica]QFR50271.1 DUF945 domain-containing protein [Sulfurimonas lithotrophica]
MKKLIIIASVVLVALASLPLIGNKIVESELSTKLKTLNSYGVQTKKEITHFKYLDTKKHYEFVVSDADKFIEYLSKFSNAQIAPYINKFLDGTTLGVDLKYSNIPISKAISVDIRPISLSKKAMDEIKNDDADFALYLEKFLKNGGLEYHIDYNVVNQEFNGHIKDIEESYTFASGQKLDARLQGSVFSGKGLLVAPEQIDSKTKSIYLDITNKTNHIKVDFQNINLLSSFESRTTYQTNMKMDSFSFDIDDDKTGKSKLNIQNPVLNFASDTKGIKAEFISKSSFEKLYLKTKQQELEISSFNYDVDLKDIDKDSFEELSKLLSLVKQDIDAKTSLKIQKLTQQLISRGFDLKVQDFSVKNMKINKTKDLEGITLKANIKLPQMALNSNTIRPMELLDKIDLDIFLQISKPMFVAITQSAPIIALSQGYAKEQGNDLVYNIKMKNSKISVNDKRVR